MKKLIFLLCTLTSLTAFAQSVISLAPGEAKAAFNSQGESVVFLCNGPSAGQDNIENAVNSLLSGQTYKSCQIVVSEGKDNSGNITYKAILQNFRTNSNLASSAVQYNRFNQDVALASIKPKIYSALSRNECH